MGVVGICRAFLHVKLYNTKIVQFYLYLLCGNAVVNVSLQLLGPCEMTAFSMSACSATPI